MRLRLIKKVAIYTGYSCNNRCRFCIDYNKRELPDKSTDQIEKEMLRARKAGNTYLELLGGETTIRKDIIHLIEFAREVGFEAINITTNGRMLSYQGFAKKLIQAGITSLAFSINGPNAEIHDYLSQVPGSFDQTIQGVKNVKKLGFDNICGNTTIVKQNYKYLPQIGKLFLKLGIKRAEFIFVDPTFGGALNHFKKLVPRVSEIASFVDKCLNLGRKNQAEWFIRYIPLCYLTSHLDQISELHESATFRTQQLAPDFQNPYYEESRKNNRAKTKRCQGCKLYNICEGIWKEYLKHYGDKELRPIN